MAQTYKSQIMRTWWWEAVVADAKKNADHEVTPDKLDVPECGDGCDDDGHVGTSYLGKHYHMFPSGRFYAPWSPRSRWEEKHDQAYAVALEAVASKYGGWIEGGEGDPTDTYFGLYVPNA